MLRGQFDGAAPWRRHMAGALLMAATAMTALLLVAPRAGAAPAGPTPAPAPSPSSSFPHYEPGLEPKPGLVPEAPGILPPESRKPLTPADGGASQGTDTAKGADKGNGSTGAKEPSAKEKKEAQQAKMRREMANKVKAYKATHGDGGVLNSFDVTDSNNLPVSAYRIETDAGGITNPIGQIQSALTQGLFEATKWMIAFGCWLIAWALQWSLARIFLKPALAISDSLYSQTIVQLGLPGVMMAFSGAVAFYNITFGRTSRGWGELFASTVISALAVSTLAAPPQLLLGDQDGAVGKARALGISVYAITTGNEKALSGTATLTEAKTRKLTRSVTDGIVDAVVVKPAFLLSYNQQLSKKCSTLYGDSRVEQAFFNDQVDAAKDKAHGKWPSLLDQGVVGDINKAINDKAVDYVVNDVLGLNPGEDFEKACVKDAGQAKKAGWDKVGGAFFIFIAALLMTLLLTVTACAYLSTEVRLGLEAILAKVALAAGIMPGAGRAWMWERATSILRLLGMLITLVVALAIVVQTVTAVLGTDFTKQGGLPAQFVVVDVTVIAAFCFRKRIKKRSMAWASSARTRLGNSPLGGRAPATMDQEAGRRRSLASTLATTALMVGAVAATGGAGAGVGGSRALMSLGGRGATTLAGRLGARAAVRGTASLAGSAERAVVGTAKAAYGAGKFGLKYTVGAPVHLPQAARTASTGLRAVPGNVARSAAQLRSRITEPVIRQVPAARDFGQTWWTNTGGRWMSNRIRMHRGLPPRPHPNAPAPATVRSSRIAPGRTAPARPTPGARSRPAAVRRAPRPVPGQPAASSQQQALRQRLYRMSSTAARTHRPSPPIPQPSPAPATPRPRPARSPRRSNP
ncbi:hypothetical protein [Streptomyces sp. RTGN2]|uniref:hypothetical protein n=1 Tax=Streptomyces sp. RTGN2 TaxID=3016525 RepID=UPI00255382A1|nr:hypothetical protein [Streptomyces sp. RTGN2]